MKPTNKLLILDLEATCSEDNSIKRSDMELIEIGAVIVSLDDFDILDKLQLYIRPVVTPKLTAFCTQLTGITQETVDAAQIFSMAVPVYKAWLSRHPEVIAWASWGNYDKGQFELDYARHGVSDLHAGWPHHNLKTLFAKATGQRRMGLGRAVKYAGVTFEGRAHYGLDDAVNMARLLTMVPKFGAVIRNKLEEKL